jgi:hypothetical protein
MSIVLLDELELVPLGELVELLDPHAAITSAATTNSAAGITLRNLIFLLSPRRGLAYQVRTLVGPRANQSRGRAV